MVGILADFNPNNESKKTPCFLAAGNVVHPPRQTDFGPCYPSLAHSPLITPLGHFDTAILSLSLLTAAKNKIFGSDPEKPLKTRSGDRSENGSECGVFSWKQNSRILKLWKWCDFCVSE